MTQLQTEKSLYFKTTINKTAVDEGMSYLVQTLRKVLKECVFLSVVCNWRLDD